MKCQDLCPADAAEDDEEQGSHEREKKNEPMEDPEEKGSGSEESRLAKPARDRGALTKERHVRTQMPYCAYMPMVRHRKRNERTPPTHDAGPRERSARRGDGVVLHHGIEHPGACFKCSQAGVIAAHSVLRPARRRIRGERNVALDVAAMSRRSSNNSSGKGSTSMVGTAGWPRGFLLRTMV